MEPKTRAGRELLAREALNSRSFALITAKGVCDVEAEAIASCHSGCIDLTLIRREVDGYHDCGGDGVCSPSCVACSLADFIRTLAPAAPAPLTVDVLAYRFWVRYRCEMVGCDLVKQHEHGGGEPTREMTPDEIAALRQPEGGA